jgi:putative membrane protein
LFNARSDSVSNIHRRWSFTRINPSSYKISYIISLISATIIISISHVHIFRTDHISFQIYLFLGLIVITLTIFLDYFLLRGTPLNKITKVFHISAFANLIWAIIMILGIASEIFLNKKGDSANYIIEGMSLSIGLRIGIFTSVFGAGIYKAIPLSLVQPLLFLFAFTPFTFYNILLLNHLGYGFSLSLILIGIVWSVVVDRSGRPGVKSTFGLLQAFLIAWTENKADRMEQIVESNASLESIATFISKFKLGNSNEVSVILPDIHPGPFKPIGGSNLPYVLYTVYSGNAIVLHSVSDHSFNIPSKGELERYIQTLSQATLSETSNVCTIPVQIKIGEYTSTGIAFGKTAIVILSRAPAGMEDINTDLRVEVERYSKQLGFLNILLVDSHNAIGEHLPSKEEEKLLLTAKQCLIKLKNTTQREFKIGYANLATIPSIDNVKEDMGQSGLSVIAIEVEGTDYVIGWADSNNMDNELRDTIISKAKYNQVNILEICTSDTHSTSGKRNRNGYYSLGEISNHDEISEKFLLLSKKSIENISTAIFELSISKTYIKVMGKTQFDDYSSALDRSMNITKIFLGVTFFAIVTMLIVS